LWTDDNLPPILNRNAWAACGNVGGTPGCVMRSDILCLELLARFGGVYLRHRREAHPSAGRDVPAGSSRLGRVREQLDIVSNAAMGFPAQPPGDVAHGGDDRRVVLRAAGMSAIRPGRDCSPVVITQYDDVALYSAGVLPHPTVGGVEVQSRRARVPEGGASLRRDVGGRQPATLLGNVARERITSLSEPSTSGC
jgi:hypothetical protein